MYTFRLQSLAKDGMCARIQPYNSTHPQLAERGDLLARDSEDRMDVNIDRHRS